MTTPSVCTVCPPLGWGVARCAHFGATTLRLLSAALMPDIATDPDEGVQFVVETMDDAQGGELTELYAGNSGDDAEATFYTAEALLLGRDA